MSGGVDPRLRNLQAALGHLADFPRFLSAALQPEGSQTQHQHQQQQASQAAPSLDLESIDVDDFPGTQEDLIAQQQNSSNQSSQGQFGFQGLAGSSASNNMPSRIPSLAELPLPSQSPSGDRSQQRPSYGGQPPRRTLVEPTPSGAATIGGVTPQQQAQPPVSGPEEFAQNPELRVKVGQVRSSSNLSLNGARIASNELKRALDAISSTTYGVRTRIFESLIPELATQQQLLDQAAGSPSQRVALAARGDSDDTPQVEEITLESLLPPPANPETLVGLQLRQYRLNQSEACLHKIQDNYRLLQQLLSARSRNTSSAQQQQGEQSAEEKRDAEGDDVQEYFAGMKRVLEQQAQEARAKLELFLSAQSNALAVQAEQFEQLRATVRSHQQHLVGQLEQRQQRLLQLESHVYDEVRFNMNALLSSRARKLQEVRAQLAQVSRYDASAAGLMQSNRQLESELTKDVEELNTFRRIYHEAHFLVTGKNASSDSGPGGDAEATVADFVGSAEPTRLSGLFPPGMLRPSESRSQGATASDVDGAVRFSFAPDVRASGRPSWPVGGTPPRVQEGGRPSQNLPLPMPELGNWGEEREAFFQQMQFGALPPQAELFGSRLSATRLPASTPVDTILQRPSATLPPPLPFNGSRDEIIEVVTEGAGTPRSGGDQAAAAPTPPLPAQATAAAVQSNAAVRVNTVPHLSRLSGAVPTSENQTTGKGEEASSRPSANVAQPQVPGAPGAHAIRHRLKVASTPQNQKLSSGSAPGSPVSTSALFPQRELTEDDIGEEDGADKGEGFFNRIASLVGLSSGQKRRTAVKTSRADSELDAEADLGQRSADRRQKMSYSTAAAASATPSGASPPQSSPARQKQRFE